MNSLVYTLPNDMGDLVISEQAVEIMSQFRQDKQWKPEGGGQLFGTIDQSRITVDIATRPKAKDLRSRFSFYPHRKSEQKEIHKQFLSGKHYLGDWHTHPEKKPTPSHDDMQRILSITQESKHELNGILMLILGLYELPHGLYVGYCDGKTTSALSIKT